MLVLKENIKEVQDYLLFIDTEATGWPKNWSAPYSRKNSWPHCVQVSWIIYDKNGREVKTEDHYINDNIKIEASAFKIHGISNDFLIKNGEPKADVMTLLQNDLLKYRPLMVGHFMQLDMHMINAEFYRLGIESPALSLPSFCTMIASSIYAGVADKRYLRLNELYTILFNKPQPGRHNAIYDARAAAECFFELVNRREIGDKEIEAQNAEEITDKMQPGYLYIGVAVLLIIITLIIVCLS